MNQVLDHLENVSKFRPLHDRVIVEVFENKENKTKGGIILPDTSKEKPNFGVVVSVGNGAFQDGKRIEMTVHAGDKVIFGKYAGTEINDATGKKYLIMKESDILCVVE